jgi:predicted porin
MSYPWVGVPPELYGWEATNYNGASVRYRTMIGDTNLAMGLFGGKETVKDALYDRLFYSSKTRVEWNNLVGADLEASQGGVTARAVYMQTDVRSTNALVGLNDKAKLRAYGLATNVDMDNWFVLTEVTQLTRDFDSGYKITAPAYTVGAGYHYGDWTPFLNYASYKEKSSNSQMYAPQSYKRWSLTLRYDLGIRSALKAQVDRNKDVTRNFGGNVTVMRLSYDQLF